VLVSTATSPSVRLHGTFINPNHFAGYLQIALAFSFGLLWRELLHNRERASGIRDLADRVEKRAIPMAGPVILWAVIGAGIALTRSRGGILAASITTLTMLTLAMIGKAHRTRVAFWIVPSVVAGLLFVAFATGDAPILRFLASDPRDPESDMRLEIWRASLRLSHHSPLVGTGLGTFREAFRRVQPAAVVGLVEQAHNDFLQMLVTGGWIGAALATLTFVSILALLLRAWGRQDHREENAFALAGIGALVALMLHGLVEFNMSIPAIPATLAVMTGLAWAAATWEQKRPSPRAADPAR
jgi:O-antigen ligase